METRLTIGEAAKLMGTHVTTLRRLANRDQIEYTRTPGGHRRFLLSDIAPFIPKDMIHVAIYVQFGQNDAIHRLAEKLESLGKIPEMSIEERSADLTRPLYSRPGIIRMADYAGQGFIQGFVTPDISLVGGWDQVHLLRLMSKLGLKCFIEQEDSLKLFPDT